MYTRLCQKEEEIDLQVVALLADGVIEESCCPWASPVVLVKKKNGDTRLSSLSLKQYNSERLLPPPRVDDNLDALAGSLWFSILDFQMATGSLRLQRKFERRWPS